MGRKTEEKIMWREVEEREVEKSMDEDGKEEGDRGVGRKAEESIK